MLQSEGHLSAWVVGNDGGLLGSRRGVPEGKGLGSRGVGDGVRRPADLPEPVDEGALL